MGSAPPPMASPRERLLAAADELFYAEGVQTVGIDRVIERAGVAKASLYSVFGSKEALVRAYLDARHDRIVEHLRHAVAQQAQPRAKLLAVFDAQAELLAASGSRGCAFARASAEAPAGGLIQEASATSRAWIGRLLLELAEAAGAPDPGALAAELQVVYHGAALATGSDGDPGLAAAGRRAAEAVIDRALAGD